MQAVKSLCLLTVFGTYLFFFLRNFVTLAWKKLPLKNFIKNINF